MSARRTRNDRKFWYCLYQGDRVPGDTAEAGVALVGETQVGDDEENVNYIVDEYGHETGEVIHRYSEAIEMWANISPASGQVQAEQFGNLADYDKVIVTCDMDCPIDEHTILFIDKEPEYTEYTANVVEAPEIDALYASETFETRTYLLPKYDYIVKRVARSLNCISIAARKVKVG